MTTEFATSSDGTRIAFERSGAGPVLVLVDGAMCYRDFGPATTHVPVETVNVQLRTGGRWDLDMVDNETGEHYPIRAELTAVIPPEYLEGVESNGAGMTPDGHSPITLRIWLHDHGDKTRMTLHQGPFQPEYRDMTVDGWNESFLKVDAILEAGL